MVFVGKSLKPVGDDVITLGGLVGLEFGAVGPGDAACIGEIVGSALEAGSNVELPTGTAGVGLGTTLGCTLAAGNPDGSAETPGVAVGTSDIIGNSFSDGSELEIVGKGVNVGTKNTLGS